MNELLVSLKLSSVGCIVENDRLLLEYGPNIAFCVLDLKQNHHKKLEPDSEVKEWALEACHRCLIYLGDIARYQNEYNSYGSSMLAQRYYHQAICLMPDVGKHFYSFIMMTFKPS